jgi:hypothetical protein
LNKDAKPERCNKAGRRPCSSLAEYYNTTKLQHECNPYFPARSCSLTLSPFCAMMEGKMGGTGIVAFRLGMKYDDDDAVGWSL